MARRLLLSLLLLAATSGTAGTDEPPAARGPVTPEVQAQHVLEHMRAQDVAGLAALARADQPDPWIVVDILVRSGDADAAEAFARAAPRPATEALPAYIHAQRGRPVDEVMVRRGREASRELAAGRPEQALAALEGLPTELGTVLEVQGQALRGYLLGMAQRRAEAVAAYALAAGAAERLGWTAVAAEQWATAGNGALQTGAFVGAIEHLQRARPHYQRLGRAMEAAFSLGNVGNAQHALGRTDEAVASFDGAYSELSALGLRAQAVHSLESISTILSAERRNQSAVQVSERALAELEELGEHRRGGDMRAHVGYLWLRLGRPARALEVLEAGIPAAQARADQPVLVRLWGALANAYREAGDFDRGLAASVRALEACRASGDEVGATRVSLDQGSIHLATGNLDAAQRACEHALQEFERLGLPADALQALNNLGSVLVERGDFAAARTAYEQVLARSAAQDDAHVLAVVWGNIGYTSERLGDAKVAGEAYERAMELAERTEAQALRGSLLWAQARVAGARGAHAEALALGRRAAQAMADPLAGLGAEQGAAARRRFVEGIDGVVRSAVASQRMDEVAYFLEVGRAGALLDGLGSAEQVSAVLLPEELRKAEESARVREARAAAALRGRVGPATPQDARARREELAAARSAYRDLIERIHRQAKAAARVVYPRPDDLAAIQRSLGPTEVLVLYGLQPHEALALVVTAKTARVVALGPTPVIEDACAALRDPRDAAGQPSLPEGAARRVRELILDPLALPAGVKRLLLAPDGALFDVPFAQVAAGREVSLIASGSILRLLREGAAAPGTGILALGDPSYPSAAARAASRSYERAGIRLAPLPATRTEVEAIGDVVLLGAEATEGKLREALAKRPRWRALHLACHGLVDLERPSLSSLAITPSVEDDGFLTALDVSRLRVPADLVALSACETARGRVFRGEGLVGLTQAFLVAGSQRVLCSLWKVDDKATAALMTKFYGLWHPKDGAAGLSAAESLRQAQAHIRAQSKWAHPYYWAAWVLWGLP